MRTIAIGKSFDDLKTVVANQELKKGTKVRFEMTLKQPVAHFFDMAGAEALFKSQMPTGLTLKDVYSPDNKYKVFIDAKANSPTILAVILFVKAHWLAISLVTIGVFYTLGYLVESIKIKSEDLMATRITQMALIVIGVVLVVYFIAKAGIRTPAVQIGG